MIFEYQGNKYEIKYKLKALLLNEQIMSGLSEEQRKSMMMQTIIMFYSFVMANVEGFNMSADEFIELLDDDPTLLPMFNEFLIDEQKKQAMILAQKKEEKANANKKKRASKNSSE